MSVCSETDGVMAVEVETLGVMFKWSFFVKLNIHTGTLFYLFLINAHAPTLRPADFTPRCLFKLLAYIRHMYAFFVCVSNMNRSSAKCFQISQVRNSYRRGGVNTEGCLRTVRLVVSLHFPDRILLGEAPGLTATCKPSFWNRHTAALSITFGVSCLLHTPLCQSRRRWAAVEFEFGLRGAAGRSPVNSLSFRYILYQESGRAKTSGLTFAPPQTLAAAAGFVESSSVDNLLANFPPELRNSPSEYVHKQHLNLKYSDGVTNE